MKFLMVSAIILLLGQTARGQFVSNGNTSGSDPKKSTAVDPPDPPAPAPLKDVYGDLLNDDPVYNRRSDWPVPYYKVFIQNVEIFLVDRYIFNYDYSHIG